ncbi:hypothetical protein [Galbibacter pacificus]|uniref:Uncharacterized protein n=1 Tax=Galbibacter pacificus TaxID=2996052 RepID=A0ABT6FRA5_9FLAO|nr:hypothetical protein [Galbibacter pacificus]MDG3581750.1 hypothetical protein [Galbibacter pacificus]MDG3585776.1 hypothetical protein [Galbibacter pacificus]
MEKNNFKPTDKQKMLLLNIFDNTDKIIWNYNLYNHLHEVLSKTEFNTIFSSLRLTGLIKQNGHQEKVYRLTDKGRKVKQLGSVDKYYDEIDRVEELKINVLKSTKITNNVSMVVSITTLIVSVLTFITLILSN